MSDNVPPEQAQQMPVPPPLQPAGSPQYGPPPPQQYAPPPTASRRSPAGAVLAVLGFGVAAAGLFALPLNGYDRLSASDIGYVETRANAAALGSRTLRGNGEQFYSGLAEFWWRFGALISMAALLLLICVVVAAPAARAVGWLLAAVAVVGGVVHGVSVAQSADYLSAARSFRGYETSNFYDHPGLGIWVSLAGFVLLAVSGVLIGLTRPRP